MHSWLRCYLYFVLLICISSSSFAITPLEKSMGGFAADTICASSTLDYCVPVEKPNAAMQACALYFVNNLSNQQNTNREYLSTYSVENLSNGVKRCSFPYKIKDTTTTGVFQQNLVSRTALCPAVSEPPPELVMFSRQGRWFSQELDSKRCYKNCLYSNGNSFIAKHYVFTNGIITEFKEIPNNRLASQQEFCSLESEPVRNTEGETTYDANCDDAFLKVFCEFVEWYRSDAEMPEPPPVKTENLAIDSYLNVGKIQVSADNTIGCFDPIEFNLFLPFSRTEIKKEISFSPLCTKLNTFGNFLRALYLLHAALIIFRR